MKNKENMVSPDINTYIADDSLTNKKGGASIYGSVRKSSISLG